MSYLPALLTDFMIVIHDHRTSSYQAQVPGAYSSMFPLVARFYGFPISISQTQRVFVSKDVSLRCSSASFLIVHYPIHIAINY